MGIIYFVRHGQASLGAQNYDQLSDLGYAQAEQLGLYFQQQQIQRILLRQRYPERFR